MKCTYMYSTIPKILRHATKYTLDSLKNMLQVDHRIGLHYEHIDVHNI